jgi:hypothetical protein
MGKCDVINSPFSLDYGEALLMCAFIICSPLHPPFYFSFFVNAYLLPHFPFELLIDSRSAKLLIMNPGN